MNAGASENTGLRSRLRLFALVGIVATAVDIGVLLRLAPANGVVAADVLALLFAALVAYIGNRVITFRGAPRARWVRNPGLFAATALVAGGVDVAITWAFEAQGLRLLIAKLLALPAAAAIRWGVYRWILFNEVRRDLAQRIDRGRDPGTVRLSVIIPAYNEAGRIGSTVDRLVAELGPRVDGDLEVVVVDDGSSDATAEVARRHGAAVVVQDRNRGKGAAVRAGMLAANGRVRAFTDADLAYAPAVVGDVVAEAEQGWDVVVGSRRHDQTTTLVRARRLREIGGRLVNWLTHLVLLGHFRDTQCGVKAFRGEVAESIFARTRLDGFAFDVEVFLIAEQDRLSLTEVPVRVENREGSSVRIIADTVSLVGDLFRVRRWAGEGWYRRPVETSAVGH